MQVSTRLNQRMRALIPAAEVLREDWFGISFYLAGAV